MNKQARQLRHHICSLLNCSNEFPVGEGVTVTLAGYTKRYCCDIHAAWALKIWAQDHHHYTVEGIKRLRDEAHHGFLANERAGKPGMLDQRDIF